MMILFQCRQTFVSRTRSSAGLIHNKAFASGLNTSGRCTRLSSSARTPHTETATTATATAGTRRNAVGVKPTTERSTMKSIRDAAAKAEGPSAGQLFIHAGLPLIAFSLLAAWVLKNSLEGKNKEYETAQGQVSKSQRQARMEEEHQDMLEKLNKIRNTDFDNTKRIERPEEILERRRREREARNVWYRRWGRWITGQS